jgi:hypothetical protein
VYIKFFVYIGFSAATTMMFGQKQTLMLHLFTASQRFVVSVWAAIVHDILIGHYLLP